MWTIKHVGRRAVHSPDLREAVRQRFTAIDVRRQAHNSVYNLRATLLVVSRGEHGQARSSSLVSFRGSAKGELDARCLIASSTCPRRPPSLLTLSLLPFIVD